MTKILCPCWRYHKPLLYSIQAKVDTYQSFPDKTPLGAWQERVWDPAFNSDVFEDFCAALNNPFGPFRAVADLPFNHTSRMVQVSADFAVDFAIVNYAKWIKKVCLLVLRRVPSLILSLIEHCVQVPFSYDP